MSDTANKNADPVTARRRRPFVVRLLRLLAFAGLALVVLLVAVVGFSETQTFRSLLRDTIVEAADSALYAHLTIESIEGNLFSGWVLGGVRLTDASGPVAEIDRVVLRYDLFRAPWKRFTINELTLNAPRIRITRAEGRDWNINTLVRPTDDTDTSSTPFDWVIAVDNLRILDGSVIVWDSTSVGPVPRDRLDGSRMHIEQLNLALSALVTPEKKQLRLNQGSWTNRAGDVSMLNLSGDITLREKGIDVDGLSVQTGRSSFLVSAGAQGADILGGLDSETLRRLHLRMLLDAPVVDVRDILYFLPSLDFLAGSASLRANVKGTLDDLRIERLRLDAARSSLDFTGRLRNILDGTRMTIDVSSDNTVIHAGDVPFIIPGIPVPDVSGLGETRFSLLRFSGEPLRFEAETDLESEAGAMAGSITLDVRGEELVYDGSLRTRGIDLAKVFGNPGLGSNLNVQGSIRGSGTRLGRMTAELRLLADSSRYQRYLANALSVNVDVRRDSMRFDLRSALGESRLAADGAMSFRPDSVTGLRLRATAARFDLSRLFDDDELESDLNFTMNADADGLDLATASGNVEMLVAPSRLKDLTIEADTFLLQLRQRPGADEYLLLQSQYADARLDGRFDLPRFASSIGTIADSLASSLAAFTLQADSADINATAPSGIRRPSARGRTATTTAGRPAVAETDTADFMDVRYSVTLKHPERIAKYFDASTFLVRGTWRGTVRGGLTGYDLDGELAMSDFYFVDSARTWLAAGVRCTYGIKDLRASQVLDRLAMDLRLSAMDLNVDGLRLSRAQMQAAWKDGMPAIRLRSLVDTLAQVDLQAEARFADHVFDVTVPRLQVLYRGETLENLEPIRLRMDSAGIALSRFDLGNGQIRVHASGMRSASGLNDFTLYADSIDVAGVEYLLTGDALAAERRSFTGIAFLEANLRGSDTEPMIAGDLFIDSIGYRGATFGEMTVESRYAGERLELYSELTHATPGGKKENVFFVSGSVPLSLSSADEGDATGPPKRSGEEASANLRLRMQEFPLELIQDFLGLFSPLSGYANGDFTVTGTASDPSFNGYLALADARGRFVFNNIDYDLGMRIEAIGSEISIVDLTVANLASDWVDGRMRATGKVATEAFSVTDFELAVNGKLKVLRPASRSAIRTLYGDLYISTGDKELTYSGRLDRSMLRGDIVVEQGELVFPLTESARGVGQYADINYLVVDDTTRQLTSSLSAGRFARLSAAAASGAAEERLPDRSVLDGLGFALTLRTAGRLRLEIPFSVLQEELNAELIIENLQVNNFGGSGMKFVGDVSLGRDSYFIFLGKRMTATGTLRFTRDPMNPDLDLRAVYSDWYYDPSTETRYLVYVIVKITGTRNEMKLEYELRRDSEDGESIESSGDVKSDVVSFLVLGVFTRDVSGSGGDRSALAEKSPEFLQQITSSIASSAATEFLGNVGLNEYIRRVDFAGIGTQDSRFKLTSEIGRAIITYDGSFSSVESANVSVDFPLSRVLGIPWTNLLIQISRRTLNESFQSTAESQQNSVWELKILQRFSF